MNKLASRLGALALFSGAALPAFAQETNPIVTLLGGVPLAGVAAAVLALCVLIVGIAMTMKGPVVAKRVINKV